MSLVGVFSGLTFDRFPSPIQRFTIYAMLYDGEGEGLIEVRIVQMETERDLYRHQRWTSFSGRGMQYQPKSKLGAAYSPPQADT